MDILRLPFKGFTLVDKNYSQAGQDLFVLSMLNGKRLGRYIEVGAGYPEYTSNTFLLETDFNWEGVSLEIKPDWAKNFNKNRTNSCICVDATRANYDTLIDAKPYDYLSIDCEPPETTLKALYRIPLKDISFRVITFEHDYYKGGASVRKEQRDYLKSYGYTLVCPDVCVESNTDSFEDWWAHPDLVPAHNINKMRTNKPKNWRQIVFEA